VAIGLVTLPAVLIGQVPGVEILRPMAIVVLGGLVTATLVTLFVVPALYLRFAGHRPPPAPPSNGAEVVPHPRHAESETPERPAFAG